MSPDKLAKLYPGWITTTQTIFSNRQNRYLVVGYGKHFHKYKSLKIIRSCLDVVGLASIHMR